ncbi:Glycoside hydrolase [Trema orientale]|uniref:Glycoside hydrolase n=1 Tax=Trema orientale TaxID=63057 RepID=A0A2P5FNS6_TREOI|nr:Glycoside hydrolase [Trema orientale]
MSKPITSSKPELDSSARDPPEFNPTEPSAPVLYPIKTLKELDSKSYFDSFHYPFNKSSVPLQAGTTSSLDRNQENRISDLNRKYEIVKNLYISPMKSKVLGTFIVEWDAGRAIADKLLATEESSKMCVERLTELAVALGFDGLLLNMEVSLNISQIPILKTFVSHLTQTMHSAIPGSLVIWYDIVTIDGSLSYQNELNDKNDILVRESKAQEAEEGLASMASN